MRPQELAGLQEEASAREAAYLVRVLEEMAPGPRVLDVGCGDGLRALALAAAGYEVTGLAPAADAFATARRRAEAAGVEVRWVAAEPAGWDDWPVGTVDAAVCLRWPTAAPDADQRRLLLRIRDHLSEGGVLVIGYSPGPLGADGFPPGATSAEIRRRRLRELSERARISAALFTLLGVSALTVVRSDADFTPFRPASPASAEVQLVVRPFARNWAALLA